MSTSYKTALRDLMETLEDMVKFAAYHKAHRTPAIASSAMHAVIAKLEPMRILGNNIIAEFEQNKQVFDDRTRTQWEEEKAQKIIALFEELSGPMRKLAEEERRFYAS